MVYVYILVEGLIYIQTVYIIPTHILAYICPYCAKSVRAHAHAHAHNLTHTIRAKVYVSLGGCSMCRELRFRCVFLCLITMPNVCRIMSLKPLDLWLNCWYGGINMILLFSSEWLIVRSFLKYVFIKLLLCVYWTLLDYLYRFFMEKQVMAHFIRILKNSKTISVTVQLLQTLNIMLQSMRSEQAICKIAYLCISVMSGYFLWYFFNMKVKTWTNEAVMVGCRLFVQQWVHQ